MVLSFVTFHVKEINSDGRSISSAAILNFASRGIANYRQEEAVASSCFAQIITE